MTKLNKQFEKARQKRLDEKSAEYDGKDNPKNYKNMSINQLWHEFEVTYAKLEKVSMEEVNPKVPETRKKLVDLSNFCSMLWERLG